MPEAGDSWSRAQWEYLKNIQQTLPIAADTIQAVIHAAERRLLKRVNTASVTVTPFT